MSPYIEASNMTVEFPIFENSHRSLKNKLLNLTTGGRIGSGEGNQPVVRALNKIDFKIQNGERVGLSGHNGCGKTTLLRVLSGVYEPVYGKLVVRGKTASLLDLSMGMDPDATGFENIYLRGVIEGLKPRIIREKVDDIADFTELGDFLNMPVRTYSSGMMLRLAFAISTSVDCEILIMDEWLSVGDESFSFKATQRLKNLISKAGILLIASHDTALIKSLCTRCIYLEHGNLVRDEKII